MRPEDVGPGRPAAGAGSHGATLLLRGPRLHTLEPGVPAGQTDRALALSGDRVLARGRAPHDLDGLRGRATRCVDLEDLCVLPGFGDAHVHQVEAEQDLGGLDLRPARSVGDVVALVREGAEHAPAGTWVVARRGWHEARLAEQRLPTTEELDRATRSHPVLLRRGSHLGALNTEGVRRAGAAAERDDSGHPTGLVRGLDRILALLGTGAHAPTDARAEALARVCALHASRGLVGVRDPGVTPDDLAVYDRLDARGGLGVRTDALRIVPHDLAVDDKLAMVASFGPPPGQRSAFLRVDGIKLFADGRVEDAALREPYEGRPDDLGALHMDAGELAAVAGSAIALGWRVAVHTVGDRALDAVLDAVERLRAKHPDLPQGWVTVEHGVIAAEAQRRRAAALGVGVVVQHPLLDAFALPMLEQWGAARATAASPVRGWLEAGALVAAGSDGHVPPFDPLRSIWGLATRRTADAGVLGAEQAVDLATALRLYSVGASWLTPWRTPVVGFQPGAYADFVAFPRCVLDAPVDALVEGLEPVLTVVGGRATHDPQGRWADVEGHRGSVS